MVTIDQATKDYLLGHGIEDPLCPLADLFTLARGYLPHDTSPEGPHFIKTADQIAAAKLYFSLITTQPQPQDHPPVPITNEVIAKAAEVLTIEQLRDLCK